MTATMTRRPKNTMTRPSSEHSRYHTRFHKGQPQPQQGLPLDQFPGWTKLKLVLLNVSPHDVERFPAQFDEVFRSVHALMRAPNWQFARRGRRELNDIRTRFALAYRTAMDWGLESEDHAVRVLQAFALTLPGVVPQAPVCPVRSESDEEW